MTRRLAIAGVVAVACLPLGACPREAPVVSVPASMLTCADAPAWRKGGTQRDVARHISDLRDAHADCRDKLGEVRTLVGEPAP
jgi:hypothetical protein